MAFDFDFTQLSDDGTELEQLARDLCNTLGYRAAWSGKGTDAGRDLIVEEPTSADFGGFPRKWLVSCKHTAVGGSSVGYKEVGDVPGRLAQHACQGFLLVTTTQPSSGLIDAFEAWEASTPYLFYYWDAPSLRRLLLREAAAPVAQAFFSRRLEGAEEEHASEEHLRLQIVEQHVLRDGMSYYLVLNDGRAFYFESRKEPQDPSVHLDDFELAFDHLAVRLPLALVTTAVRGVYYDDKHSSYTWRVDVAFQEGVERFDIEGVGDRLSGVLVHSGNWGGQWHEFGFRVVDADAISPVTPRLDDEQRLQLFAKWPDEPPQEYGR